MVGGGPAGLEAARVAAECGHRVTLVEASDKLGGQFRLAGMQPRRVQILGLLDWHERQLTKLQVVVRLNAPMEPDEVEGFESDIDNPIPRASIPSPPSGKMRARNRREEERSPVSS